MNRIIKFRGLRIDGKGWAYGTYCYKLSRHSIQINQISEYGSNPQVIPESVGQFTGLTDENGNEVYEGDIIEFTTYAGGGFNRIGIKCQAVVVYGEYNLQDDVLGGSVGFYLKKENSDYAISIKYWLYSNKAIVTGNIHENN